MPITDVELNRLPAGEEKSIEEKLDHPKHITILDLSEEDQKRIAEEICDELDVIEKERSDFYKQGTSGWEAFCDEMDNLYDGEMQKLPDQMFNLDVPTTKTKIREYVRKAKAAFFRPDPAFSVTPRPEFQKMERGIEVCEKQQDFLDHKLDDVIPLEPVCANVFSEAGKKGVGILKMFPETHWERKSREECYYGKKEIVTDSSGRALIDQQTGEPITRIPGLEEFIENYKEDIEKGKYKGYIEQLMNGKDVKVTANYTDVTFNDVMPKSVNPKHIWVRKGTDGYLGLCKQRTKAEQIDFTYWELKDMEKRFNFYNVDKLFQEEVKDQEGNFKYKNGYKKESYCIFEVVHTTELPEVGEDGEKEERKAIFWVDREKKIIIGSIEYPFYSVPCYWFPYNVKTDKTGWYKDGIATDLKDSHISKSAMLNFTLQGAWQANTITPITKNPDVIRQFLENEFIHGLPVDAMPDEIRFLNERMPRFDSNSFVGLLAYLTRMDEDVTGIASTILSGRENPLDPDAPASKHAMQLENTNENIRDYIETLADTHNQVGQAILQFYYQLEDDEEVRYKSKKNNQDFGKITKSEMIAKTHIQTQATSFNLDKINEKREDLALMQMARQDMMIAKRPESIYYLWKSLLKSWSPKWRAQIDKILPSPEEFQKEQLQIMVQAVQAYVQQALMQAQATGQPPQFDPRVLMQTMEQFATEAFNNIEKKDGEASNVSAQGIISQS